MRYPITKQIDEQLQMLANRLPRVTKLNQKGKEIRRPKLVPVTGAQMLKKNPKAKDSAGKPIDPTHTYTEYRKVYADHYRELRAIYLLTGPEGIEQYAAQTHARFRNYITDATEVADIKIALTLIAAAISDLQAKGAK